MADSDSLLARARTGIEGLDMILNGGFPRNRTHLVEGDPGSGKTTLGIQFLLDGYHQEERVLYVSLSETMDDLRSIAESHGWNLEGIRICDLAASEDDLKPDSQYTLFHPSEIELDETTEAILAEVERIQPHRVVIDSLSELRLLARDPLRYRRQILALKRYFAGQQITVLLLNDSHAEMGDTQLPTLVYGVVVLENLSPAYGTDRRRLRITKLRGSPFQGGYHDFTLRTGGMEVYPRLVPSDGPSLADKKETISSGVSEIDLMLSGGFHRGTNTLIQGPTGCGKSTLALQCCIAAAARGEKSVYYTFDEELGTLFYRAQSLGMDLSDWTRQGRITMQQVHPSEVTPGGFAHMVRQAVNRDNAKIIVVDSLNGYLYAMQDERFLSSHLHDLFIYLNRLGIVTLTILTQHGLFGLPTSIESSLDISYLSDAVILIRFFEAAGQVHKALSVMKNRGGPHESTIRELAIGPKGLTVGEPLKNFVGVLTGTPEYLPVTRKSFEMNRTETSEEHRGN